MVDTVLSRDKNWVRWKAEGCPPIERPAIPATEFVGARERATKAYANKRLRSAPAGSLDLRFLADGDSSMERLKEPERFNTPEAESVLKSMANDDLDLEMAQSPEETENLNKAKTSKSWRALRLSLKSRLAAFERVDDGKNLQVLLEPSITDGGGAEKTGEKEGDGGRVEGHQPTERQQDSSSSGQADTQMTDAEGPPEGKASEGKPATEEQRNKSQATEGQQQGEEKTDA